VSTARSPRYLQSEMRSVPFVSLLVHINLGEIMVWADTVADALLLIFNSSDVDLTLCRSRRSLPNAVCTKCRKTSHDAAAAPLFPPSL